jgi:hypothetical protein
MALARFHHQDKEYLEWHSHNLEQGFIVNLDDTTPGGTRLHRATCPTLQVPIDKRMSLTGEYAKVCSTIRHELDPFWQPNGGRLCATCAP